MTPKALTTLLRVMSTERRVCIIKALLDAGEPIPLSMVAAMCRIDEGTASYNLKALCDIGLVTRNPSGRWVFFAINKVVMKELIRFWRVKEKHPR